MDGRVERVVTLMNEDVARGLPVRKMAQAVNLSPTRFCHIFKNEMGVSPVRYLRTLRMRSAATLLRSTFLGIKEIMVKVGFKDDSHFVRDFKRLFGVTPTAYRKANRRRWHSEFSIEHHPTRRSANE